MSEQLFKQTLFDRQHHRQALLKYSTQIGKLKGLNFAIDQVT